MRLDALPALFPTFQDLTLYKHSLLRLRGGGRNDKSKQIVDRAIANGKIHGINLHPGVENLGNGNCALECVLDSINTRECFQESYDGTPDHFCLI